MQDWATSMDSASSAVRVPSFSEVERKSMMARARRFLEAGVDALKETFSFVVVGSCDGEGDLP